MSKANIEALKEIARWLVITIFAWIISEIIRQGNLIIDFYQVKIYTFTFLIPIRSVFILGLTILGRYLDKLKHEKMKTLKKYPQGMTPSSGILPF